MVPKRFCWRVGGIGGCDFVAIHPPFGSKSSVEQPFGERGYHGRPRGKGPGKHKEFGEGMFLRCSNF